MHFYRNILKAACIIACIAGGSFSTKALSIRDVNTDLDTAKIVLPESFEIDVHDLMTNWYIQRYTVMDKEADSRSSVVLSDEDYIDRLHRLPTVIEMPFNPIVGNFIRLYVERKKGLVESLLALSLYYMPIFHQTFDKYGLPLELCNLAIIESALNPNAVSRAGATGLWQFMSATATGEGLEINSLIDERRDPYKSTDAAARYLKKLYNMFEDWSLAIAAYNCGPGNVSKAIKRAGGGKKDFWEIYRFLPSETRDYIPAFIAANYAMTYYKDHNISPVLASKPIIVDSIHVNRRVHFQQISDILDIPMEELRILNPQYRTDLIPGDIKPYSLVLPNIQVYNYIANEDSIVNHNAELYARRDVVLPATSTTVSAGQNGEYVEEVVTTYHKVKRGETIASVARRYGISQSEVKRANKGSRTLKRGTTLRLKTIQRKFVPSTTQPADSTSTTVPAQNVTPGDSLAVSNKEQPNIEPDIKNNEENVTQETPSSSETNSQVKEAIKNSTQPEQNATTITHNVKAGENLFRIATQYGITVAQLKEANNLTDDNVMAGATLIIPGKETQVQKAPASKATPVRKKTNRRRRR